MNDSLPSLNTPTPSAGPGLFRKIVTLGLFSSFLGAAFCGLALFVRPEEDPAALARWTFLGIKSEGWGETHRIFIVIFVALAALHIVLNWKTLVGYLRKRRA
jgi:Domain of unknown function (DUF4405)